MKNQKNEFEIDLYDLRLHPSKYKDFEIESSFVDKISNEVIWLNNESNIKINVRATNASDGFYLNGAVEYELDGSCSKCLDDIKSKKTTKFDALFVEEILDDEKDPSVYQLNGTYANLVPLIIDIIGSGLDYKPLCSVNCKGLCTVCGENLNNVKQHTCKKSNL